MIPRTMSTQHPDNVRMPFFVSGEVFNSEDEIREARCVYDWGCQEQMWDYEGKESDDQVVAKLLARNEAFFQSHPLGEDRFLTLRIPNPAVETDEPKLLMEILESIPRFYDTATKFYGNESAPVFEVILPMTTSVEALSRVYYYYRNFVVGKGSLTAFPSDSINIAQWLGPFKPERIDVIPLFEDWLSLLNAHEIVGAYLSDKDLEYQRVFLARSDPALNYGTMASVLFLNVALQRLAALEKRVGIPLYPILGVGSSPFRGNFKPTNVESTLKGYASCQTFTLQSAFKYDWDQETVVAAIRQLNSAPRGEPLPVDEEKAIALAQKTMAAYQAQIPLVAPLVNRLTPFVPRRRLRKLHIGLFGYSRNAGSVRLPRAIPFCASLYSVGLPPEILGLQCLDADDLEVVKGVYPSPNFEEDLRDALTYFNPRVLSLLPPSLAEQVKAALSAIGVDFEVDKRHQRVTDEVIDCLREGWTDRLRELIVAGGAIRGFLG
ncbi:MAG: phosphoenolpyruvate carboxylase [Chloroflexi bacterium]|nr:phosphoenolpyruvate carboxylase [Chloroflexota bacterium]